MKLRGETVIRFGGEVATVSTESKSIYKKLIKRGYKATTEDEDHAVFEMPLEDIKIPRPKRKLTPEHLAQLAENAKKAHKPKE